MRTKTKRRRHRKFAEKGRAYKAGEIDEAKLKASLQSFLGALSHVDTYEMQQKLKNMIVTTD